MIDFARPAPPPTHVPAPGTDPVDLARLGEEIARLSAHIQAATYRLLAMIRAFDEAGGWHAEGFRSCARWLSWRTGIGPGAAREKVRVARALGELPVLSGALAAGELSYSAARALTRVATPENESELVEVARHTPAAELERLVRAWRAADRAEDLAFERARHVDRSLSLRPTADGSWEIRGRLDPEVGAVLREALDAAGEALFRGGAADSQAPAPAKRADALGLVAEAALGEGLGAGAGEGRTKVAEGPDAAEDGETDAVAGSVDPTAEARAGDRPAPAPVVGRAERFQVVVHVSAETLCGGQDRAAADGGPEESTDGAGAPGAHVPRVAGGPHISAETARRLACDASVVGMVQGSGSEVLDVGRKRRTVPAALRRALDRRDGGCRFPGCGSRFCDAHHIVPWAAGGETRLENLVLLCRHHHRRVHEDGWRVERVSGGGTRQSRGRGDGFTFRRPDGRRVPRVPPPDPVPAHPAAALARAQRHLGIAGDTATPAWDGARMDVDWALCTLRRPAVPAAGVPAETPQVREPTTEPRSQQETSPRRRRR